MEKLEMLSNSINEILQEETRNSFNDPKILRENIFNITTKTFDFFIDLFSLYILLFKDLKHKKMFLLMMMLETNIWNTKNIIDI